MKVNTDPYCLEKGKLWLQELASSSCPQYNERVTYIRSSVEAGRYAYAELGSTAAEVLDRGIFHAGEAAKCAVTSKDTILAQARWNALRTLRNALDSAKPPVYATNVVSIDKMRTAIEVPVAA